MWWGKTGDPAKTGMAEARQSVINGQLAAGIPTYVFLLAGGQSGTLWRTRLQALRTDRPAVEADLIPEYYRQKLGEHHLWLKLTEFEELEPAYVFERLEPADNAGGSLAKSLSGQTNLMYVRVRPGKASPGGEDPVEEKVGAADLPAQHLTVEMLKSVAENEPYNLRFSDDDLYATVVAAIESGKHIILTGPPGTAKTTLAQALGDAARSINRCSGFLLTTATADWTTYETIGGLKPTGPDKLEFTYGHFLEAIDRKQWLVIDELNRSQFDRAFGQLFTVLSGQPVTLPYTREGAPAPLTLLPEGHTAPTDPADVLTIPSAWRIVGTMNVFDKSLLFEMSYALMRRFAFIEVPSPSDEIFESLIDKWGEGSAVGADTAKSLMAVRAVKDVGPAVYRDIARFAAKRAELGAIPAGKLRLQAFYTYLLPQFEGLDDSDGRKLYRAVVKQVGQGLSDEVEAMLRNVLGLQYVKQASGLGDAVDELDDSEDGDDAIADELTAEPGTE